MKTELLAITPNAEDVLWTAARTCTSYDPPDASIVPMAKKEALIKKVFDSGHWSVGEHVSLTYRITGITRACTHQAVRHRHMSFSQQSQRFVTEQEQLKFYMPESIKNSVFNLQYQSHMREAHALNERLRKAGVPAEDARMVTPNAALSSMILTTNLNGLVNFAKQRLCTRAQTEIRTLAKEMCDIAIKQIPLMEDYLQPKCVALGKCPESNSCGRILND
jgi:thymidylate synthase (FAD)